MSSFQVIGLKSDKIIQFRDDVFETLKSTIQTNEFSFHNGDILIITSKVISMEQQSAIWKDNIDPSLEAQKLANLAKMDPQFVQAILDQKDVEVLDYVPHALLTLTTYGAIPNGGVDQSNSPHGWFILLPQDVNEYVNSFRDKLVREYGTKISVIVADSTVTPLRKGTSGIALAVSGIDPVIDDRGKLDLFGYKMQITSRAIADNIVTAANIVMGETDELMPFAVVRGLSLSPSDQSKSTEFLIPTDQCLFFGPYLRSKVTREE